MRRALTLEEGAVFGGKLERIREFYDRGVRMAAVSWNYENEIGFPNLVWERMAFLLSENARSVGSQPLGQKP